MEREVVAILADKLKKGMLIRLLTEAEFAEIDDVIEFNGLVYVWLGHSGRCIKYPVGSDVEVLAETYQF